MVGGQRPVRGRMPPPEASRRAKAYRRPKACRRAKASMEARVVCPKIIFS